MLIYIQTSTVLINLSGAGWKLDVFYLLVYTPVCLFVCVEVLQPSQPNGVMSSAVSLPNHTLTGQACSSKRLTSIVHSLSPETDNCPSWISRRERMTVENISWSISTKECCRPRRGLNPQPPGLQGIFSRRQIDDIFLIFSQRRQFAWNVKSCFQGKIRKIFQNIVCWKFYPEC